MSEHLSKSHFHASRTCHEALSILKENGGELRLTEIYRILEESKNISDYELELTKSGTPRWKMYLNFFSIEMSYAGYIIRKKGVWMLTKEGTQALNQSSSEFFKSFHKLYLHRIKDKRMGNDIEDKIADNANELENLQSKATEGIINYIKNKNPYEFQDLVGALLRGMGYYTPFIAPKGKDGGIDILAYRDPLGSTKPILKVQVKHYPNTPISVDMIRSLIGVLSNQDEVGLFVSSGIFTNEARREARSSHRTIRLIDINEFVELWGSYYERLKEEDKSLLPIKPIYFLNNDII